MSAGSRPLPGLSRRLTRQSVWIWTWVIGSMLPIIPYASPLWTGAWADTPYAYLVWIPVFAFLWGSWTLRRVFRYNDDAELNGLVGIPLIVFTGSLLVAGMTTWQFYFVGQNIGLLIWPFWSLGLAWLMFGVGVTRYLLRPLAYLFLCWPPLYSSIVAFTNPILDNLANIGVTRLAQAFSWLRIGTPVGTYVVFHGTHGIPVYVTSVCSGADSFLAMVILFPIILVSFTGHWLKKLILVAAGALLAIFANLTRLVLIIIALHQFGSQFALGVLHPVLGVILFVIMVLIIMAVGKVIGLSVRRFEKTPHLRKPGYARFGVATLSIGLLTVLLLPLYSASPGTTREPVSVTTNNLDAIMPSLLGWRRQLIGNYNEASILGPGSKSTALTYATVQGDYAMAELWWTYQPISLQGYAENNCMLFHGESILGTKTLRINKSMTATVYTILLPPNVIGGKRNVYVDTVYSYSVKFHGRRAYIRSEIAAPVMFGLHQNSPATEQVANAVSQLAASAGQTVSAVAPLNADRSIYLHNYFVFIAQFSQRLLSDTGVHQAAPATSPPHSA